MNNDLISREWLKDAFDNLCCHDCKKCRNFRIEDSFYKCNLIENAPTIEVPENAVNCVLTMFGKCSYNETGCSDCEIKDKIRKALNERPQGEWIRTGSLGNGNAHYECSNCHYGDEHAESQEVPYCWHCGAKMQKGGEEE